MDLVALMQEAAAGGASDLFVSAGKIPHVRIAGKVVPLEEEVIDSQIIDDFRNSVLLASAEQDYAETGSCDAGITLDDGRRFRINFLSQQGRPSMVVRPVPFADDLSFESLNLPRVLEREAENQRGLILICGSAGSGKSTTMAAMVSHINRTFNKHIVTIEDPIEFVLRDDQSLITQREVGADTSSFNEALRNVLRESPDVIVIGEMRDLETMQTAISAALTGHLVISTVHTADTVQAVERIINHFPVHQREQAAADLSLALCCIEAQRLLPGIVDNMVPAVEFLQATPLIRSLIAQRAFKDLEEAINRGGEESMITFNRAIFDLFREEKITLETGCSGATNKDEFLLLARGMESGIDTFRDAFGAGSADENELNMKRLLQSAIACDASDLILSAGCRPSVRVNGELLALDTDTLQPSDTKRLLFSIVTPRQRANFEEHRELDFALTTNINASDEEGPGTQYRFRVNGFYQRGSIGAALRLIPSRIPKPEELGLPQSIIRMADKKQGLILVTGPTGHGKSTTLAALIDRINSQRGCHIITIEDPIEYVHENKMAVVEQREVHADTMSFTNALKYVLRQDPDVILIGEMRDPETISAALTAAETGHLVLATLHTNNAPQSIDRIIDSFPAHQQNQIKLQVAGTILGILAQRLVPRKTGEGRIAAFEIMTGTPAVQSLIREGKTAHLQSIIETGFKDGMMTMDRALRELYQENKISREAYNSLTKTVSTQAEF